MRWRPRNWRRQPRPQPGLPPAPPTAANGETTVVSIVRSPFGPSGRPLRLTLRRNGEVVPDLHGAQLHVGDSVSIRSTVAVEADYWRQEKTTAIHLVATGTAGSFGRQGLRFTLYKDGKTVPGVCDWAFYPGDSLKVVHHAEFAANEQYQTRDTDYTFWAEGN